jgi:hypothetical protein
MPCQRGHLRALYRFASRLYTASGHMPPAGAYHRAHAIIRVTRPGGPLCRSWLTLPKAAESALPRSTPGSASEGHRAPYTGVAIMATTPTRMCLRPPVPCPVTPHARQTSRVTLWACRKGAGRAGIGLAPRRPCRSSGDGLLMRAAALRIRCQNGAVVLTLCRTTGAG